MVLRILPDGQMLPLGKIFVVLGVEQTDDDDDDDEDEVAPLKLEPE